STFYLAQKAVIPVVQTITVPAGVTLATYGVAGPRQYALMARLVREVASTDSVVHVSAGANLTSVWTDGSANRLPASSQAWNIRVPDRGVSSDRPTNTTGDQHILAEGAGSVTVANNLITGYAGVADGIGAFGANVAVTGNTLIDIGNVGVGVFPQPP